MELAETCRSCGKVQGCDCKSALVRFFGILQAADQRVSTLQPTSVIGATQPVAAHLDKLTFELASPLPRQEVLHRLQQSKLQSRVLKLRDRHWYLQIGDSDSGIYCSLMGINALHIHRIVTRPSAFPNYAVYLQRIDQLLHPDEIALAKINRLDLALDYPQKFQPLLAGLDYEHKQNRTSFQDKGGQRTGMNIGSGAEKIVVYDKAVEQKQQTPLTRIEIQLSGKKLPCRSLKEIEHALAQTAWNPFKAISLNSVTFAHSQAALTPPQKARLQRLQGIIEREGLFSARRTLNDQGNFIRDYGGLLTVHPWPEQPADSFKQKIAHFFNAIPKETQDGNYRKTETS